MEEFGAPKVVLNAILRVRLSVSTVGHLLSPDAARDESAENMALIIDTDYLVSPILHRHRALLSLFLVK